MISPHLDDAVFSCGTLIAATAFTQRVLIMTVCAGIPEEDAPLASLDAAAGFRSSREAVLARRAEDARAARIIGATVVHLDVLDQQHDRGDPLDRPARIREELARTFVGDAYAMRLVTLIAPLGLRHIDHRHVAVACASLADYWYEELPYRVLWPETRPTGLGAPFLELPSCPAKAEAILCYRSQLGDGPPGLELAAPERYHRAIA